MVRISKTLLLLSYALNRSLGYTVDIISGAICYRMFNIYGSVAFGIILIALGR